MTDLPVITNAVPLPIRCHVTSYGKRISLQAAIRALKEGESFVVDGENARSQAINIGNRVGVSITTEIIKDEPDDKLRFRVWRKPNP